MRLGKEAQQSPEPPICLSQFNSSRVLWLFLKATIKILWWICKVLVIRNNYHLTRCKLCSSNIYRKCHLVLFPFFHFADVGLCSSFRSHTDVVIVYCLQSACWCSLTRLKREQFVYVLIAALRTSLRDEGLSLLFLAGCGTGSSVLHFCFRVGRTFSPEASNDVCDSAAAFPPVIKVK